MTDVVIAKSKCAAGVLNGGRVAFPSHAPSSPTGKDPAVLHVDKMNQGERRLDGWSLGDSKEEFAF